ncbi:kinase-like domain-containing protein [Linnemannia elongata]|nr:kinase-like domain-containing protein [Linnemannia elongata]
MNSGNSLLLRLFKSEFFNAWIAVSYLFKYPDAVGIQHYLCNELKKFPLDEIEFFLPQLVHLLISRPSESVALENFILDRCQISSHMAILTLWYLQAYTSDLAASPNTPSFKLCKRVFNKCQAIVFATEAPGEYEDIFGKNGVPKVKENALSAMVGMGVMLAAFGQPLMTKSPGQLALAQGRRPRAFSTAGDTLEDAVVGESSTQQHQPPHQHQHHQPPQPVQPQQPVPVIETTHESPQESGRPRYSHDTAPSSPISLKFSDRGSMDGQSSAASLELARRSYFHSEMQFLLALVDIATRLVIVPKPARLSALRAELTLLNHNLPAEICVPLWCHATLENPSHHRVVRIPPQDAVVLNSADRVPYLLQVEVLETDMRRMKSPAPSSSPGIRPVTQSRSNEAYLQTVLKRRASNSADDFAEKMRTAAVMLAHIKAKATSVEDIRAKIIKEMMALEEQRMQRMKLEGVSSGVGGGGGEGAGSEMLEDERKVMANVTTDDPSAAVFAEDWDAKMNRIRATSPYGHLPSWQLLSVIVKQGADLRQEQLACQLIREMGWIWERAKIDVWITYMRILVTSDNSGLIETVRNTISIHSIKKDAYARRLNEVGVVFTLYDYFQQKFGDPASEKFIKAQDNFMRSLAAYSVITYVLQIRDRHNGNILLDTEGHIVHIDFGFMLSNSPGSVGFELAPFKLPQEYLDVLGGVNSEKFAEFKVLLKKAFMAIRKHTENIVLLIDMMSKDSKLPCFQYENAAQAVRDRLALNLTEVQAEEFVEKLIMSSCCNVFTRLYDTFQYYSNGIL